MNNMDMSRPVLISGIALGVATALPPLNVINFCTCCSLFALTGFLAVYLMKRDSPATLTMGQGALVGLAAGALGGLVHTAFSIPITLLMQSLFPVNKELLEKAIEAVGDENSPWARVLKELSSRGAETVTLFTIAWLVTTIVKLVMTVILFGIFATLGGIVAVAVLQRNEKAAVYIPPVPQQQPPVPPDDAPPPPLPPTPLA